MIPDPRAQPQPGKTRLPEPPVLFMLPAAPARMSRIRDQRIGAGPAESRPVRAPVGLFVDKLDAPCYPS